LIASCLPAAAAGETGQQKAPYNNEKQPDFPMAAAAEKCIENMAVFAGSYRE